MKVEIFHNIKNKGSILVKKVPYFINLVMVYMGAVSSCNEKYGNTIMKLKSPKDKIIPDRMREIYPAFFIFLIP